MHSTIENRQSTIHRLLAWVALLSLALWIAASGITHAAPQGLSSAFTYQGYLEFSSGPVNNDTDMRFSLYDEEMGGTPIAGPIVFDGTGTNLDPVDVVNGYFTVTLDFGTSPIYTGTALWLEIEIRQHTPTFDGQCDPGGAPLCILGGSPCPGGGQTCIPRPFYLLQPRTSLTGTPHALGLRYPQTGRAEIDGPMFNMIQSGEGSVLEIESADDVCIEGSSPTFKATNLACGSVAKFVSQPPQFNPAPPPPTLEAQNFSGGVGVSVLLAPHPEATMVNPSVPALAVTNRATGVAALFHIPDPMLPIEDGCPPQCPPFPWPWTDVVAPGIDVINQSGGPAGRFSTDSNLLLPAVHIANVGMGTAVQAVNNNAVPTLEATNNGGGSAGKLVAVAFNPQPDPPYPTLESVNEGCGSAAKLVAGAVGASALGRTNGGDGGVASNHMECGTLSPALEAIHQGGGSAGRFESNSALLPAVYVANMGDGMGCEVVSQGTGAALAASNTGSGSGIIVVNNNPAPTFEATNNGGGSAGRFASDSALLPAVHVANMGDGMACEVVSQGSAAALAATNTGTGSGIIIVNNSPAPALSATNAGAGSAMKALSGDPGFPTIEAANTAGTAIRATSTSGLCFDGEGDLRITGDFTKNYGNGSPSFHRTGPIAYATINSDGTVAAGTPNVSSVWNLPNQRYEITITGETYDTSTYVTTVTPVAIAPADTLFANTSSGGGQLRVKINSSSAGTVGQQKPFHFVVYKP